MLFLASYFIFSHLLSFNDHLFHLPTSLKIKKKSEYVKVIFFPSFKSLMKYKSCLKNCGVTSKTLERNSYYVSKNFSINQILLYFLNYDGIFSFWLELQIPLSINQILGVVWIIHKGFREMIPQLLLFAI